MNRYTQSVIFSSCLALLAGCGSSAGPAVQTEVNPKGVYRVAKILCDGAESSTANSDTLKNDITITLDFTTGAAVRITDFFGCVQTIPMNPIDFSAPNIMTITEGNASCVPSTAGACNAVQSACNTTPFTFQATYNYDGANLIMHIPLNPNQDNPCGPGQGTSDIQFVMTPI